MTRAREAQSSALPTTGSGWYALHRSGMQHAGDKRAFDSWLNADPRNRAAYLEAQRAWKLAARLRDHPEILKLREDAFKAYPPPNRMWRGAIAASLAGALLVSGWAAWQHGDFGNSPGPVDALMAQSTFSTEIGQRSATAMPDGSRIVLDTDSVVEASISKDLRAFELVRGRARFNVAPDKTRPFVVTAGGNRVIATGTIFDVRYERARLEVSLIEGSVRVERMGADPRRASTSLKDGQRLQQTPSGHWERGAFSPVRQIGWASGRLSFDNEPLAAVVTELNRYSERKIIVASDRLGQTPIVGVFRSSDPGEFVRLLTETGIARVGSSSEQAVTLLPPDP